MVPGVRPWSPVTKRIMTLANVKSTFVVGRQPSRLKQSTKGKMADLSRRLVKKTLMLVVNVGT